MSVKITDNGKGWDIKIRNPPQNISESFFKSSNANSLNSYSAQFNYYASSTQLLNFNFFGNFDQIAQNKNITNLFDFLNNYNNFIVNDITVTSIDLITNEKNLEYYQGSNINLKDFFSFLSGDETIVKYFLNGNDEYTEINKLDITNPENYLNVFLFDGDDRYTHLHPKMTSWDFFDGGTGNDTIIFQKYSTVMKIELTKNKFTNPNDSRGILDGLYITDQTGSLNDIQVNNVENIQFADFTLDATSLTKTARLSHSNIVNLVELYIASFNRAPDSVGLDYWGSRYYDGLNNIPNGMSLEQIAKSFFTQKETIAAYPSGMATKDFVTTVYNNVLSRGPDTDGLNYWVGQLDKGIVSKDSFLLAIINGAMASTGSAVDRQTLANKEAVGEHYAIYQGLNNSTNWAKDVMSAVTDQMATVTAANAKTDSYAAIAANPATSDLVVKLVGVAV